MKAKKIAFYGLMFLPLASALIALQFLPEQIPAHYGLNNQVTRWGSKYEALIIPIVTVMLGYFFLGIAKAAAKHEENGNNNENVCIVAGIVTLIIFNAMTGYALYAGFHKIENLSSNKFDMSQLLFGILGIAMIITGNIMPKLRMNAVTGLKTRWSMKNETTWKKSQRFGGISYMIGGVVIVVMCFFVQGIFCFLSSAGVIAVLLIIDVFYTYKISQIC
ncbi:MAG: DUF1648 domain-containing protein [Lachnospiraceae bacterium]|nr:DUF1648 domain-containing protein [Lachnospiraceae bacterium]